MSKTTVTITTDGMTDAQIRAITKAADTILKLEPSDAAIARAVKAAASIRGMGYSGRGVSAVLAHVTHGATSTATVARLLLAADGIAGEWPEVGDSAAAITATLYRIACKGKAADVTRAADLGRKAANGDDAHTAVTGVLSDLRRADARAAITPPERTPQIGAQGQTEPEADDTTDAVQVAAAQTGAGATASLSIAALIAALTARVTARGFTPDAVLTEAFDALAVAWEDAAAKVTA